jgi:hypothetical protein
MCFHPHCNDIMKISTLLVLHTCPSRSKFFKLYQKTFHNVTLLYSFLILFTNPYSWCTWTQSVWYKFFYICDGLHIIFSNVYRNRKYKAKLRIASRTPSTLSCLVLFKEFGPFYNFHKYVFVPNPQNKGRVFEKNFSKFPSISVFASWWLWMLHHLFFGCSRFIHHQCNLLMAKVMEIVFFWSQIDIFKKGKKKI